MQEPAKSKKTGLERIREIFQKFKITSPYGFRKFDGKFHNGVDLNTPIGTEIIFKKGEYDSYRAWNDTIYGGGFSCVVTKNRVIFGFAHLHKNAEIDKNENLIIITGNTGRSTGPHLHLTMRLMIDGVFREVDPEKAIKQGIAIGRQNTLDFSQNSKIVEFGKIDINKMFYGDEINKSKGIAIVILIGSIGYFIIKNIIKI